MRLRAIWVIALPHTLRIGPNNSYFGWTPCEYPFITTFYGLNIRESFFRESIHSAAAGELPHRLFRSRKPKRPGLLWAEWISPIITILSAFFSRAPTRIRAASNEVSLLPKIYSDIPATWS